MAAIPPLPLRPRVDCTVGTHLRVRLWSHAGVVAHGRGSAHPGVELAWIDEGAVRYRIGERTVEVAAGEAFVVPSQVEHVTLFPTGMRGGALWIDAASVAEIADAMGPRARGLGEADVLETSATMLGLARALACEVERREDGHVLAIDAIAEAMIVEMLRRTRDPETTETPCARAPRDRRVRAAVECIESRFAEELGVDELAKAAGMSRFHFSRLFRDQVGEAPYRHLQRVRVARAAELLRRGHHSVTDAAFSVGFRDLGRFSRAFRAQLGCRPIELVRAARLRAGEGLSCPRTPSTGSAASPASRRG